MKKHVIEDQLSVVLGNVNEQKTMILELRKTVSRAIVNIKKLGKEANRLTQSIDKKTDGDDDYPSSFADALEECGSRPFVNDEEIQEALFDEDADLQEVDIKKALREIFDFAEND